jgi:glutamate-1-semialdehyde 2,1-aminomutase
LNIDNFDKSNELYQRASQTVPLASQTFSKSVVNLVKGASPLFLESGDGCRVTDVDGNVYIDYILGLMPVVLGYRDPDVDAAIRDQLDRGIIFSLATRLEMELSERLVRLIPCAEMVRFGKNGSDATSAAIRLARAYTGRDRIIACGYHGWHDWYIGSTARSLGVPEAVRELTSTVPFNDASAVENLLKSNPDGYAALILEPAGAADPEPGYLERLRELTDEFGVVLVFDEIVTGFRIDMGGAQKKYGVKPDLACFGKAMANGMPIAAIVGSEKIMSLMTEIFFSGTFGGEALSLAASIATLDKLEAMDGPGRIARVGTRLANGTVDVLNRHGLGPRFGVKGPDWRPYIVALETGSPAMLATSLWRQEAISEGLLMGSGFNISTSHDNEDTIRETLTKLDASAAKVAAAFASNDPQSFLRGDLIEPVFQIRKD